MKAIVCLAANYPFDLDQNRAKQKICLARRCIFPDFCRFLRLLAAWFDAGQFDPCRNH